MSKKKLCSVLTLFSVSLSILSGCSNEIDLGFLNAKNTSSVAEHNTRGEESEDSLNSSLNIVADVQSTEPDTESENVSEAENDKTELDKLDKYYVTGVSDNIAVRESADDKSSKLCSLIYGDPVYVIDDSDEEYAYIYIEYGDIYGYIKKRYLVDNESAACSAETYYAKEKTSIYDSYNAENAIKSVNKNTKITVIAKTAGNYWYVNISDTDIYGYISNEKISRNKTETASSQATSSAAASSSQPTASYPSTSTSPVNSSYYSNNYQTTIIFPVPSKNPVFTSISASSHRADEGDYTYICENTLYDNGNCWCEGVSGKGKGEYIVFAADTTQYVNGIVITNGYVESEDKFWDNGRVTKLKFEFSNGVTSTAEISPYKMDKQTITFESEIATKYIKIIIADAVEGDLYDDTCISLIIPF